MRRVLLSRGEHARHEGCGMNVKRERKRGRLNPDKGLVGIASFNCIPSPWLFIVHICEREKRRGKKKVGRKRVARSHIKPLYEGKSSCLSWLNHGLKLLKVSERGVRVSRILEAIPFFLSLSFGHFNAHWNLTFQPPLSCPPPRQLYIYIYISLYRGIKVVGKKFVELQTSRPPFRPSRLDPSLCVYLSGARPWTLIQSRDVNVADCRRGQNVYQR